MKHLIKNKQNTIKNSKLHSPSSHSKQSLAPQMHTPQNTNSQISIKPVATQSLLSKTETTIRVAINTFRFNNLFTFKYTFRIANASKIRKSQFEPNNHTSNNNLHSINKFAAKAVQMSERKHENTLNN